MASPASSEKVSASGQLGIENDKLSIEELRRFMSLLSKDQLVDLVVSAAATHNDVYTSAHDQVQASPASRRLMIRNISYGTTDEAYLTFLSQFGEVEDAVICRNPAGKSKGFGFATFKQVESVKACLESISTLDGRPLHAKLAADIYADFNQGGRNLPDVSSRRKLFIRNLADSTDNSALQAEFSKFGEIEESVVVVDGEGKSRGYGFVTFVHPDSSIKAVQQPQRVINGRIAFVSFAIPKNMKTPRDFGVVTDEEMGLRGYSVGPSGIPPGTYPSYPYLVDPLQAIAAGLSTSRNQGYMGSRMGPSPVSQAAYNPSVPSQSCPPQAFNQYYAAAQAAYLAQAQGSHAMGYQPSSGFQSLGSCDAVRGAPKGNRR